MGRRPFLDAVRAACRLHRHDLGGGFLGARWPSTGKEALTLLKVARKSGPGRVLLFTADGGRTMRPNRFADAFDIEQFTGHNALKMPPPVLAYVQTAPPGDVALPRPVSLHRAAGNRVSLGEPIR